MKTTALRLSALILSILSIAAMSLPTQWATCQARVMKIWNEELGDWDLVMLCQGLCSRDGFSCKGANEGFGDPEPGWYERCECTDVNGNVDPNKPPCQGSVWFNPDLHGPGVGGYEMEPCPVAENCGTVSTPRFCTGVTSLNDVPEAPDLKALCWCPEP